MLVEPETDANGVPAFGKSPYSRAVCLRTFLELHGRQDWQMPEDAEDLIEGVYDEDRAVEWPDDAWREAYERAVERDKAKWGKDVHTAGNGLIGSPSPDDPDADPFFVNLGPTLDEDDPTVHEQYQARTRLGPPTVMAICLYKQIDGRVTYDAEGIETYVQSNPIPFAQIKRLLQRSVSIQKQGVVQALWNAPTPSRWRKAAMLRHAKALKFEPSPDGAWRCTIPGSNFGVRLDPKLGLVWEKDA